MRKVIVLLCTSGGIGIGESDNFSCSAFLSQTAR